MDQPSSPGTSKEALGGQEGTETLKEGAWGQLTAPHPARPPPLRATATMPGGIPAFLVHQKPKRGSRHAPGHTCYTAYSSPTCSCHHVALQTPTRGLTLALRAGSLPPRPRPRPGHASRCKPPGPRITASHSGALRRETENEGA